MTHKEALEAAYLAGFNASGEGYNGEYPFGDKMQDPAENPAWKKDRDNYIKEALAQPKQNTVEAVKAVLKGIDQTEIESQDGWWETSAGAEFGAKKLKYIVGLLAQPELCKYGQEPKSCTSSPMDCQCALDATFAQPEQEPTNLERHERNVQKFLGTPHRKEPEQEDYLSKAYRLANELRCHLAIAPAPQRTWVWLTYEEQEEIVANSHSIRDCVTKTTAKLKEKNT